jgi:hypothetical protein
MSAIAPTVEFSPNDISDAGLAELRNLALSAMRAAGKFGEWLHGWTDAEQARRAKHEDTCRKSHALGLPVLADWSDAEVGEGLEAVGVLVHAVNDFTASQFAERLQLAVSMEAGRRLRGKNDE